MGIFKAFQLLEAKAMTYNMTYSASHRLQDKTYYIVYKILYSVKVLESKKKYKNKKLFQLLLFSVRTWERKAK